MNNGQQDNGGGGDVTKLQQQLQDIKDQVTTPTTPCVPSSSSGLFLFGVKFSISGLVRFFYLYPFPLVSSLFI